LIIHWFCCINCASNAVMVSFAYFDLFWQFMCFVSADCLQCVNYFLCSLQNILLLNTFSKFSWKLAWIWRHADLTCLWNQIYLFLSYMVFEICFNVSHMFSHSFFPVGCNATAMRKSHRLRQIEELICSIKNALMP
jgi:hypothetical protein